jgi:hypothetical protein
VNETTLVDVRYQAGAALPADARLLETAR